MRRHRTLRSRLGATVIEVVVAATLLGIVAGAVARTAVILMQENRISLDQVAQSQATRTQAERYRSIPFDELAVGTYRFPVDSSGAVDTLSAGGARDTLVVVITAPRPDAPEAKRIQTYIIRR